MWSLPVKEAFALISLLHVSNIFCSFPDYDESQEHEPVIRGVCQTRGYAPEYRLLVRYRRCYPTGKRGPCGPGQLFVIEDEDVGKCFKPEKYTCDELNDSDEGALYNSMYRFHNLTGKCQRILDRGPCGNQQAFFALDDQYGECQCDRIGLSGALIYWPADDACYWARVRGPCRYGQLLTLNFQGVPVCQSDPCKKKGEHHIMWPGDGKCHLSDGSSRGPCPPESVLDWSQGGSCVYTGGGIPHHFDSSIPSPMIKCEPGYRPISGNNTCKPKHDSINYGLCGHPLEWDPELKGCVFSEDKPNNGFKKPSDEILEIRP